MCNAMFSATVPASACGSAGAAVAVAGRLSWRAGAPCARCARLGAAVRVRGWRGGEIAGRAPPQGTRTRPEPCALRAGAVAAAGRLQSPAACAGGGAPSGPARPGPALPPREEGSGDRYHILTGSCRWRRRQIPVAARCLLSTRGGGSCRSIAVMDAAVYARITQELEGGGGGGVEERLARATAATQQPYSRVRAVQRLLQRRQLRKAAASGSRGGHAQAAAVFSLYRSHVRVDGASEACWGRKGAEGRGRKEKTGQWLGSLLGCAAARGASAGAQGVLRAGRAERGAHRGQSARRQRGVGCAARGSRNLKQSSAEKGQRQRGTKREKGRKCMCIYVCVCVCVCVWSRASRKGQGWRQPGTASG